MERRSFLKSLFVGAASVAAGGVLLPDDPELALWRPGTKTIFIPEGDIKVRNIRAATDAEIAAITGQHKVRIKEGNNIFVMTEGDYRRSAVAAFRLAEVHFDDGTIAYNVNPMKETYDQSHVRAIEASRANRAAFANRPPARPANTTYAEAVKWESARLGPIHREWRTRQVFMVGRAARKADTMLSQRIYNEWTKRYPTGVRLDRRSLAEHLAITDRKG